MGLGLAGVGAPPGPFIFFGRFGLETSVKKTFARLYDESESGNVLEKARILQTDRTAAISRSLMGNHAVTLKVIPFVWDDGWYGSCEQPLHHCPRRYLRTREVGDGNRAREILRVTYA